MGGSLRLGIFVFMYLVKKLASSYFIEKETQKANTHVIIRKMETKMPVRSLFMPTGLAKLKH